MRLRHSPDIRLAQELSHGTALQAVPQVQSVRVKTQSASDPPPVGQQNCPLFCLIVRHQHDRKPIDRHHHLGRRPGHLIGQAIVSRIIGRAHLYTVVGRACRAGVCEPTQGVIGVSGRFEEPSDFGVIAT